MTTTTEVQTAVSEDAGLFVSAIKGLRNVPENSITRSNVEGIIADLLLGKERAAVGEAVEWIRRAEAGDLGAQAAVDGIEPWISEPEFLNDRVEYLIEHVLKKFLPAVTGSAGKRAAHRAPPGQLEQVERHSDRLAKFWAPKVKAGSGPALAWECLAELSPDGAPVDGDRWQDETVHGYLSASHSLADRQAAFRVAKARLRGQGAFTEDRKGAIRRKM
jgi:hypothetical protein